MTSGGCASCWESRILGGDAHVYNGNGDEVLICTTGGGWHEKEARAHGAALVNAGELNK